jgi:hypothetical protein
VVGGPASEIEAGEGRNKGPFLERFVFLGWIVLNLANCAVNGLFRVEVHLPLMLGP